MITALLPLIGFSLLVTELFGFEIAIALFNVTAGIIIFEYYGGLIGYLPLVSKLLYYTGTALLPLIIMKQWRQKTISIKNIFSPAMVFFLITSIVAWLLVHNGIFHSWDEFSHWGLISKEIFLNNHLQDGNSVTFMPEYPPGTALFHYFIYTILGFSEGYAYFAQDLLCLGGLSILLLGQNWQRRSVFITTSGIILFLFVAIGQGAYLLQVDTVLSVIFGAIFALYFQQRDQSNIIYKLILPIALLPLIKAVGSLLALICVTTILVDQFVFYQKTYRSYISLLALIAVSTVSHLSWQHYISNHHFNVTFKTALPIATVIKNFVAPHTITVLTSFAEKYLTFDLLKFIVAFAFWMIYILLYRNSNQRKSFLYLNASLFIGYLMFCIGLIILYINSFSVYEATHTASLIRYLNIYNIAWAFFLITAASNAILKTEKTQTNIVPALTGLAVFMISLYTLDTARTVAWLAHLKQNPVRASVEQFLSKSYYQHSYNDKVFFINQHSTGQELYIFKYLTLSNHINNFCWSLAKPGVKSDVWTCNLSSEAFSEKLKDYNTLVIMHEDPEFNHTYKKAVTLFAKKSNNHLVRLYMR